MTAITDTATVSSATRTNHWDRLLIWAAGTVIAADIAVQALAQAIIPPLAIVTLLGLVGLGLLPIKRRAGIAVLGGLALLWAVGSVGFSADHLQHPESGIDFVHAVIEIAGRIVVAVAAVGAWRGAGRTWVRRVAAGGLSVLAAALLVGTVGTATRSGDAAQAEDVAATVEHAEFPELTVATGDSLFVENADLFRHTFTVEGTGIDVELPARAGARVPIDLAPGTYTLMCTVPGHEFMETTLTVR